MIDYFLNPHSVEALGWTLLHSLWQGAVFALLLVLILIALRSYSAQSRYVVSVGLLCAFFLTLSATFWLQWQAADARAERRASPFHHQSADDVFTLDTGTENGLQSDSENERTGPLHGELLTQHQASWLVACSAYYNRHLPLFVTLWLLGVLFLQLRFLGQLAYVQRLKHYGTQLFPTSWSDRIEELEGKLRIQKKVGYLTSMRIESPMVIGWLKPVVLVPRQLFNSLSETEIYAVLAHELAHIRREDFIVNLLQTVLCNVFFFHPGVWWMSNRIDDEREHCCDDLAVAATGPATSYAKTLINVSELQLNMHKNTPLAMALSGKRKKRERGGFSARVRRLFMANNGVGSFREKFATAFILITVLFLGVAATGSTVQTIDTPTPSTADQAEIISEPAAPKNIKLKKDNKTLSTIIKTDDDSTSTINQGLDQSELPIANPAEPVASVKPATPMDPVKSDEAHIDALVMACWMGDFDSVKTLLNSGIAINAIGSQGFTPLMTATSKAETAIVAYLIKHGADVNQSYLGWTALIEAADEGSLASMKLLLEAGADVHYYWTPASPTAISMAASEGHLDCLQLLLDHGADINGTGKSVPPLHAAAEEGKSAIMDYLLSQKINLNKKDAAGRTALMYAASEGQQYAVIQLMEAGADLAIVDNNGATASDYAEHEDEYETLDYIKRKEDRRADQRAEKRPAIHQATLDGFIEKVQRMVEQGTDVNTRDDYGRTSLHIAAALNHNIDMRVLIDLGADINAQDQQGRTPLMYAAADGKGDAVALLVSERANVNIQDVDGMRAYEWGQSGGNSDLAKFLSLITEDKNRNHKNESRRNKQNKNTEKNQEKRNQNNFRTDVRTDVDRTTVNETQKRETFHIAADGNHLRQYDLEENIPALLEAARHGSVDDCANLLINGLSVNSADDTGQTALMVAARTNRLDIAKYLIEQGADVNMSSASGLTALHYAALENYDQMARLLLNNHAQVDPTMRYSSTDGNYGTEPLVWEYIGATPLLIAVESGNMEVISVLIDANANTNHSLIKKEYKLNKDRVTYLSGGEVMGLDTDFLKEVEFQTSDDTWTPYKQALLLNKSEILVLFPR